MKKPLVLTVFGTRPEVIKLAPVVRALRACDQLSTQVCVTAQHRQMLDVMLSNFDIRPDHDLDLMRPNQDLIGFSARALPRIQDILRRVRPDFVLVQGDTTTAFVTALAAFYERVPVGHVEAGLRSFDAANPYPEETNRVMISRLADLHFVPTTIARKNLLSEGIPALKIVQTGNTVVDSLRLEGARPARFRDPALRAALDAMPAGGKAVVVTTHRRENHGRPLASLCDAFRTLVERHPELHLFYPVHMNPAISSVVRGRLRHPRAHLLPALDYFDLIGLLRRCDFVMTDSGGLQEEAPSLGKPVIVLRETTERPEAVAAGAALLAGTGTDAVVRAATRLLRDREFHASMARGWGIFGDGRASARILGSLRHYFGFSSRRPLEFRSVTRATKSIHPAAMVPPSGR